MPGRIWHVVAVLCCLIGTASAEGWPWPAPAEWAEANLARTVERDLDHDGVEDLLVEYSEGGSGYRSWLGCAWHGASGERTCIQYNTTSYSLFRGFRMFGDSEGPARKVLKDVIPPCIELDRKDPRQGALWQLHESASDQKRLAWSRGRPARHYPTCLTLEEASEFTGALTWHEAGKPEEDSPAWTVLYEPIWQRSVLRRPHLSKRAADKRFRLFVQRHALVIYDKLKHRHAWIANFEGMVTDDFKLDRWQTIKDINQENRDIFTVVLNLGAGKEATARLNVVHLLFGRALKLPEL